MAVETDIALRDGSRFTCARRALRRGRAGGLLRRPVGGVARVPVLQRGGRSAGPCHEGPRGRRRRRARAGVVCAEACMGAGLRLARSPTRRALLFASPPRVRRPRTRWISLPAPPRRSSGARWTPFSPTQRRRGGDDLRAAALRRAGGRPRGDPRRVRARPCRPGPPRVPRAPGTWPTTRRSGPRVGGGGGALAGPRGRLLRHRSAPADPFPNCGRRCRPGGRHGRGGSCRGRRLAFPAGGRGAAGVLRRRERASRWASSPRGVREAALDVGRASRGEGLGARPAAQVPVRGRAAGRHARGGRAALRGRSARAGGPSPGGSAAPGGPSSIC